MTRCEITTYEPDLVMDIAFDEDQQVQKLIMKVNLRSAVLALSGVPSCSLRVQSEWLRDAFAELDPTSDKVVFHFSPPDKHVPTAYNRFRAGRDGDDEGPRSIFRLESIGTHGSSEVRLAVGLKCLSC